MIPLPSKKVKKSFSISLIGANLLLIPITYYAKIEVYRFGPISLTQQRKSFEKSSNRSLTIYFFRICTASHASFSFTDPLAMAVPT